MICVDPVFGRTTQTYNAIICVVHARSPQHTSYEGSPRGHEKRANPVHVCRRVILKPLDFTSKILTMESKILTITQLETCTGLATFFQRPRRLQECSHVSRCRKKAVRKQFGPRIKVLHRFRGLEGDGGGTMGVGARSYRPDPTLEAQQPGNRQETFTKQMCWGDMWT